MACRHLSTSSLVVYVCACACVFLCVCACPAAIHRIIPCPCLDSPSIHRESMSCQWQKLIFEDVAGCDTGPELSDLYVVPQTMNPQQGAELQKWEGNVLIWQNECRESRLWLSTANQGLTVGVYIHYVHILVWQWINQVTSQTECVTCDWKCISHI